MAKGNLMNTVKELSGQAAEILDKARNARRSADALYEALRQMEAEAARQKEEEVARRRREQ